MTEKGNKRFSWRTVNASQLLVIALLIIALVPVVLSFFSLVQKAGAFSVFIGMAIMVTGYYHTVSILPRMAKEAKTGLAEDSINRANLQASKVSSWLVVIGLVIVFLGLFDMVGLIPTLA